MLSHSTKTLQGLSHPKGCNSRSIQFQTLQKEINVHLLAMEKGPSPKKAQGTSADRKSKPQFPARKDSHIFWESAAVINPRRQILCTLQIAERVLKSPPCSQTICTFSKQDLNLSSPTDKNTNVFLETHFQQFAKERRI